VRTTHSRFVIHRFVIHIPPELRPLVFIAALLLVTDLAFQTYVTVGGALVCPSSIASGVYAGHAALVCLPDLPGHTPTRSASSTKASDTLAHARANDLGE